MLKPWICVLSGLILSVVAQATTELNFSQNRDKAVRVRDGGAVDYVDPNGEHHILVVNPDIEEAHFDQNGNVVMRAGQTEEVMDPETGATLRISNLSASNAGTGSKSPAPKKSSAGNH